MTIVSGAWRIRLSPSTGYQNRSPATKTLASCLKSVSSPHLIVTIKCGLETLFKQDANVFVAGDLFWYPVEGDNRIRQAPDTMVIFGRPKGHRGSYLQWLEGGIAPQVVFEVLSPGNRAGEMREKREFYARYGVEEYYEYDPDRGALRGWQWERETLNPIPQMQGWISPRLKARFDLEGEDLVLTGPEG